MNKKIFFFLKKMTKNLFKLAVIMYKWDDKHFKSGLLAVLISI